MASSAVQLAGRSYVGQQQYILGGPGCIMYGIATVEVLLYLQGFYGLPVEIGHDVGIVSGLIISRTGTWLNEICFGENPGASWL